MIAKGLQKDVKRMPKGLQKDCKRIAKISKGFEGVKELIGVRFVH